MRKSKKGEEFAEELVRIDKEEQTQERYEKMVWAEYNRYIRK